MAELRRSGHALVLVHGGGKMLSRTLDRMGIPTQFHQGLRVTDEATRDVALMVLAGIVNKQWVAELQAVGQAALGICGGDAGLVQARRISAGSNGLGYVGRPRKVNTAILETAFREGLIPVVAPLALGARGEFLNINADDLAAALAMALKADRLLYLTESGGVWDADHQLLPVVKQGEIRRLIQKGVVRDGMIPKLLSCARTLRHQVGEIDITSALAPNVLIRTIADVDHKGTRIVKSNSAL
jgi:acetylglutamate kinase